MTHNITLDHAQVFLAAAKAAGACSGEYARLKRAVDAGDLAEIAAVAKDNIGWIIGKPSVLAALPERLTLDGVGYWHDGKGLRVPVVAGDYGTAQAGDYGTAQAGNYGTAQAGNWGTLVIKHWDDAADRSRLMVAYVGEDGIEPNIPYKLDGNGKFIKA
jgi:hypothetical protein